MIFEVATSTAFSLSSEIVSADILNIFVFTVITGIILGIFISLLKMATWWLWK